MKLVRFRGSALRDLRNFPEEVRRQAGYQLNKVQREEEPTDWKPMPTLGSGVHEIRVRGSTGAYRLVYVAKFQDAVYVLHCFQKKTQKTHKLDLDVASQRYADLVKELGQ